MKDEAQFHTSHGTYSANMAADAVGQGALLNAQLMRHGFEILYRFRWRSMSFFVLTMSIDRGRFLVLATRIHLRLKAIRSAGSRSERDARPNGHQRV